MKKISILGSTGSIGTQTLEVVRENKDIEVLAGRSMCRARELLFYAIIILKVRQAVMDMHRFGAFFLMIQYRYESGGHY